MINRWQCGDAGALDEVTPYLYDGLKRLEDLIRDIETAEEPSERGLERARRLLAEATEEG